MADKVTPLPGQGSGTARFDRWAAEHEQVEYRTESLSNFRGTADRGQGGYQINLAGAQVGRGARSEDDLVAAIRRSIRGSHLVENARDAELFITAAVNAYRERNAIRDPEWSLLMTGGLSREHEEWLVSRRRQRVGQIAKQIAQDPIWQERLAWNEEVSRLSAEFGLDPQFVEDFLRAYYAETSPRHPGVIDPRGVPFVQIGAGRSAAAWLIKNFIPGFGIYEGITGKDVLTGQKLAWWERALGIVLDLLPLVPAKVLRPIGRVGSRVVGGIARGAAGVGRVAAEWAIAAIRTNVKPAVMLRFIGRIARLPIDRVRALIARLRQARAAKGALQLSADEQALLREIDDAFREFQGVAPSAPAVKMPTARGFIFLNRLQPQVLSRLLDRPLRGARSAVSAALQQADDIAENIRGRIVAHWDAALPRGETMAQAAARVFRELRRVNPANPNQWVRGRLYDQWRTRAMRRIYRDQALRRDLLEQAGIVVGRNPRTNTHSMHIRTQARGGGRTQTPIDFDHARIGHSQAVQRALNTNDFRALISTVHPSNLQLMTGRENRNFIEAIREALRNMSG